MKTGKMGWKKLGIWTTVIVLLVSTLSLSVWTRQAMAVSVADAVKQMKEAAQVQLVTNTFKKCVSMQMAKGDYPGGFSKIVPNMFNYKTGGLGQNKEVTAGAWLENQVQGKVNNGTIYCNDNDANLINVFASTMGVSVTDVVCNGTQPGILKARVNGKDIDGECASGVNADGVTFLWNTEAGAMAHLKKLYNNRLSGNPYKVDWSSINTFSDDLVNYYLYLSEFQTACSSGSPYSGNPKLMDKSRYFSAIKVPDVTTGALKETYYSNQSITEDNWDSGWLNSDQAHTCEAVIAKINKKADAVQTKLNDVIADNLDSAKHDCQLRATQVQTVLEAELDGLGDDEEAKKKLTERIDLVKKLRDKSGTTEGYKSDGKGNDRTWKTDSSGGIVCRFNPDNPHEMDGDDTPIYNPKDEDTSGTDTGLETTPGGGTEESESLCAKASGSLTWIVCSVMQLVGDSTSKIYDMIEESFLTIDTGFMAVKGPTYNVWQKFQGFANIAFAIVLLVIILSQITGFGVTNYGIKKILPSLIMVAVLTNLSFFICQIAVDISNILGYEFRQKFVEFGQEIEIQEAAFGNGGAGAIIGYVVTAVVGLAGAKAAGAALFSNFGAWVWPFLVSLLGVAVGVLFFFILLGLRQTGIIVLVVLAPLAFICYALPNTKSLFDRWRKMLTSLLVVYPVCGLLMGGGQFVSRLLLSNVRAEDVSSAGAAYMGSTMFGVVENGISNFFYVIVAMLIQVVPFFFIPSIVKSSMAAMGNIGAKLSTFGKGLSKASMGAIKKSEGYKDKVARGKARDAAWSLGRRKLGEKMRDNLRTKGKAGRAAAFMLGGAGETMRSWNNPISRAAQNARNQQEAKWVDAIAGQRASDSRAAMTVKNGLQKAEDKENATIAEDWHQSYKRDLAFATDTAKQRTTYQSLLNAVDANPTDRNAMNQLRGLQHFLSGTDGGRQMMKDEINARMGTEQATAAAAGRDAMVSDGMRAVAQNLHNDHPELKNIDRGFDRMLEDMSSSDAKKIFSNVDSHGAPIGFAAQTLTKADGSTYSAIGNAYYDAMGAKKYDARSIAGADESTLQRLAANIGTMGPQDAAAIYRSATEALENENIGVKPENEDYLNNIRRAAYTAMQPDFAAKNAANFYDSKGGEYTWDSGRMAYIRDGNISELYRYNTATGDMTNTTTGAVIGMMDIARGNTTKGFEFAHGKYRDLHKSMKVKH